MELLPCMLHWFDKRNGLWLSKLGGCDFDSDSEYLEAKVIVDPSAKNHPTVKGHGMSFMYTADWTNHTESVTGKPGFQVLLRVDESTYEPVREFFQDRGGRAMGKDHPSHGPIPSMEGFSTLNWGMMCDHWKPPLAGNI